MYLYDNVSEFMLRKYGLYTAVVTGSVDGRTTAKLKRADMNTILTCFSPRSKDRDMFDSIPKVDIDILIATDCISEGQNLQDCDYLINYDIHWNPVPVSYTHLDVYKRQASARMRCCVPQSVPHGTLVYWLQVNCGSRFPL